MTSRVRSYINPKAKQFYILSLINMLKIIHLSLKQILVFPYRVTCNTIFYCWPYCIIESEIFVFREEKLCKYIRSLAVYTHRLQTLTSQYNLPSGNGNHMSRDNCGELSVFVLNKCLILT